MGGTTLLLLLVVSLLCCEACWRCLHPSTARVGLRLAPPLPSQALLLPMRTRLYSRDAVTPTEPELDSKLPPLLWQDESEMGESDEEEVEEELEEEDSQLKEVMLGLIMWYKRTLSPLMPSNCRFLPTCSSYGLDAIQKYGSIKGGVLTAWRILRCNPLGGAGYDAPVWPPPSYFAGSNTFPPKRR